LASKIMPNSSAKMRRGLIDKGFAVTFMRTTNYHERPGGMHIMRTWERRIRGLLWDACDFVAERGEMVLTGFLCFTLAALGTTLIVSLN